MCCLCSWHIAFAAANSELAGWLMSRVLGPHGSLPADVPLTSGGNRILLPGRCAVSPLVCFTFAVVLHMCVPTCTCTCVQHKLCTCSLPLSNTHAALTQRERKREHTNARAHTHTLYLLQAASTTSRAGTLRTSNLLEWRVCWR